MTSLVEALTEKWIEKGKQLDAALARIAELEAAQVDKTSNPQGRLVDNTADLQARVDGLEEALAERTRERDAAIALVAELVQIENDHDDVVFVRLYGKPHTPEHKARVLDLRQRKADAWRKARDAIDAAMKDAS